MDTFRQRVYWDKINKKHYYPIYEEFGIKKRARITNDLYFDILFGLLSSVSHNDWPLPPKALIVLVFSSILIFSPAINLSCFLSTYSLVVASLKNVGVPTSISLLPLTSIPLSSFGTIKLGLSLLISHNDYHYYH